MEAHADQISQEVTSFKTGEAWKDTAGKQIQAHGGLIQKFGDTYYWYGEDKTRGGRPIDGVRAYSSKDLYNWTDEGTVLKVMENREQFEMDEYFKTLYFDYNDAEKDEVYLNLRSSNCIVERPKVLYNEKTGKYVMWFHSDRRQGRRRIPAPPATPGQWRVWQSVIPRMDRSSTWTALSFIG